jgi:hypothetical protein
MIHAAAENVIQSATHRFFIPAIFAIFVENFGMKIKVDESETK